MAKSKVLNANKQIQPPNFFGDDGRLFLVRCFKCNPERGTENYAPAVASGQCAWCGWSYEKDILGKD